MPEKELTKEKYLNRKRALEISCYVVGAGAFGVFVRWLQVMMAFNEEGLVDKSFFNFGFGTDKFFFVIINHATSPSFRS